MMTQVIASIHPVHLLNANSAKQLLSAEPSDQSNLLSCESTCRLLSSVSTIAIYYYSAQNLTLVLPCHRE